MSKIRFDPGLYEALKQTKPKGPRQEVSAPGPRRQTPAPATKMSRFEVEPARLNLGGHPQLVISLSATACYAVIFGLAALLAIAFLLGRASSPLPTSPAAGPASVPPRTVRRPLPEQATGTPTVESEEPPSTPVRPTPTAGPWRIRADWGDQKEVQKTVQQLRAQGLTDFSVERAGSGLAVYYGHFATEQALRKSSEFATIKKMFSDAYPQKVE